VKGAGGLKYEWRFACSGTLTFLSGRKSMNADALGTQVQTKLNCVDMSKYELAT